jgi:hypothetical protein
MCTFSVQGIMAFTVPRCIVMKKIDVKVVACSFEIPYLFWKSYK